MTTAKPNDDEQPATELAPADRVRWNLLGDLVFEDSYALWEVLRADSPLADVSPGNATAYREHAVIALLDLGWIYVFRLAGLDPNEASQRPELRLTAEEARQHVANVIAFGEPCVEVWLAPTELGVAAANHPPAPVRELWGWAA